MIESNCSANTSFVNIALTLFLALSLIYSCLSADAFIISMIFCPHAS